MKASVWARLLFWPSLAVISGLLSTAGCDGESPEARRDRDAAQDTGPTELPLPEISCEPNLDSIQRDIFEKTCSFVICHSMNGYAAGLVFERTDARQELVGVDSFTCNGWKRVVPGAPEQSLLWNKLSSDAPACGPRMPWLYERLPAHALECIRQWIVALESETDAGKDGS